MRRNPFAVATMLYVPAGASSLNVPSGFALTDATKLSLRSYNRTVTTFEAITCPVTAAPGPAVAVGGDDVNVCMGISVTVGVGDPAGTDVNVGVGDPAGMEVNVGVGNGAFGPAIFCTVPLE